MCIQKLHTSKTIKETLKRNCFQNSNNDILKGIRKCIQKEIDVERTSDCDAHIKRDAYIFGHRVYFILCYAFAQAVASHIVNSL